MMMPGNGQLSVPPGFRFHPTEEELLYYYLRKKVLCEAIDLDVIREVDLNKLEPWDLKEKCRIGSSGPPQNEWYFFSHKDKKYPTGTRTNRATTAGFWKATGRDKAISNSINKRIGMRKTLVFYTGRAPHGQKTDWIMHEYRLLDDNDVTQLLQEDGWVVCRVFKKKSTTHHERELAQEMEHYTNTKNTTGSPHHAQNPQAYYGCNLDDEGASNSIHLPQLLNPESLTSVNPPHSSFMPPFSFNNITTNNHHHHEHDHNLLNLLTSSNNCSSSNLGGTTGLMMQQQERPFGGEYWSFLDKLLSSSSNQNHLMDQNHMMTMIKNHPTISLQAQAHANEGHRAESSSTFQRFPFQYLGGSETDHHMLK